MVDAFKTISSQKGLYPKQNNHVKISLETEVNTGFSVNKIFFLMHNTNYNYIPPKSLKMTIVFGHSSVQTFDQTPFILHKMSEITSKQSSFTSKFL